MGGEVKNGGRKKGERRTRREKTTIRTSRVEYEALQTLGVLRREKVLQTRLEEVVRLENLWVC
jgi:hypothetical protein